MQNRKPWEERFFTWGIHPAQAILQFWIQGLNPLASFSSYPLTPARASHGPNPTRSQMARKPTDVVHIHQFPGAKNRVGRMEKALGRRWGTEDILDSDTILIKGQHESRSWKIRSSKKKVIPDVKVANDRRGVAQKSIIQMLAGRVL